VRQVGHLQDLDETFSDIRVMYLMDATRKTFYSGSLACYEFNIVSGKN